MGLRSRSIGEAIRDRGDDPGHYGEGPEAELGVVLFGGVGDHGVEGEVRRPGHGAQNDHGEHEGEILGVEYAFGLFVHPAITDGLVGPFGHQTFYFAGPAVLELLDFFGLL